MHSDSKKHRSYLALLFTAGDVGRYIVTNNFKFYISYKYSINSA